MNDNALVAPLLLMDPLAGISSLILSYNTSLLPNYLFIIVVLEHPNLVRINNRVALMVNLRHNVENATVVAWDHEGQVVFINTLKSGKYSCVSHIKWPGPEPWSCFTDRWCISYLYSHVTKVHVPLIAATLFHMMWETLILYIILSHLLHIQGRLRIAC